MTVPLFLLPPAGGSAALFREWSQLPGLDPRPVELPGRGLLLAESPQNSLTGLADLLDARHRPRRNAPWAVLGHSMGALTAAAWACRAAERGHPPVAVYLSAAVPPWLLSTAEPLTGLSDTELWSRMAALGGVPPELADRPAARRLLVGVLRADIIAAASWRPANAPSLGCPVTVFGGRDDPACPSGLLDGWRDSAVGGFRRLLLPGGHFYRDGLVDLLAAVRSERMP